MWTTMPRELKKRQRKTNRHHPCPRTLPMFRFTIRDVMAMTALAGMGVAWAADHQRLNAAFNQVKEAREEAATWESRCAFRDQEVERLEKGIRQFGFEVMWSCGIGPSVCRRLPD